MPTCKCRRTSGHRFSRPFTESRAPRFSRERRIRSSRCASPPRGCIGHDDARREEGQGPVVFPWDVSFTDVFFAAHPCRAAEFAYPPCLCPLCPKHAIKSTPRPSRRRRFPTNVGRKPYSPRDARRTRERQRERKGTKKEKEAKENEEDREGGGKGALGGRANPPALSAFPLSPLPSPPPEPSTHVRRSTSVSA